MIQWFNDLMIQCDSIVPQWSSQSIQSIKSCIKHENNLGTFTFFFLYLKFFFFYFTYYPKNHSIKTISSNQNWFRFPRKLFPQNFVWNEWKKIYLFSVSLHRFKVKAIYSQIKLFAKQHNEENFYTSSNSLCRNIPTTKKILGLLNENKSWSQSISWICFMHSVCQYSLFLAIFPNFLQFL